MQNCTVNIIIINKNEQNIKLLHIGVNAANIRRPTPKLLQFQNAKAIKTLKQIIRI